MSFVSLTSSELRFLSRNLKAVHFFLSTDMPKPVCSLELLTTFNAFLFSIAVFVTAALQKQGMEENRSQEFAS